MGTKIQLKRYGDSGWENLDPITDWSNINNKPSTYTPSSHTHSQYLTSHQDISGKVDKVISLSAGVDLNTIVSSGFYRINGSPQNGFSGADWSQMIVSKGSDTITQIGLPYSSQYVYFRSGVISNSQISGSWTRLANASEIPSLSGYATQSWVTDKGYLTSHQDISGKADKVSMTAGTYKRVTVNSQGIVTAGDNTDSDTNYYHTRVYSSGLKISTGTGVSDMYVPNPSTSHSGVMPALLSASITTQSQSTKFLREDGSWAVPSYTTDTNTWRGIQDNLTSSTNTTESLSAKQGYLLANGSARDNTKVPTRIGGIVYNCLGHYYNSGSTASYIKISLPSQSYTWSMLTIELTVRQEYQSGKAGKMLIYGNWSSGNWSLLNVTLDSRISSMNVYNSGKSDIYISGLSSWGGLSIDKITCGDNVTSYDISNITVAGATALPSSYVTATKYIRALTSEIPTVYDWAKASTKPSYSFSGTAATSGANSGSAISCIGGGSVSLADTASSGGIVFLTGEVSGSTLTITTKRLTASFTGSGGGSCAPSGHTHSVTATGSVS